jgi:hypothetical protein
MRALLHLFADALLHQVEGVRRLPRFTRAGLVQRWAVEVFAQTLGGVAQALDRAAQQFGAVPGGNHQRDELERQRHQRPAEPRTWRAMGETRIRRPLSVDALGKFRRGRRWGRAVVVKPGKGQQMRQDDRHQQHAKQAAEQRVEAPSHQPMSRASNR